MAGFFRPEKTSGTDVTDFRKLAGFFLSIFSKNQWIHWSPFFFQLPISPIQSTQ
jgi:hypothetical protein